MTETKESATVFDNVFRTIVEKMPQLLIGLINEMFQRQYPQDTPVRHYRNEHMTPRGKIITDSVELVGGEIYHIECQSLPDNRMIVRMFEYDLYIALEEADRSKENVFNIRMPRSGVLYLRGASGPEKLRLLLPDGQEVTYTTVTMFAQDYTQDDIFQKKLLFLVPFYAMRYEKALYQDGGMDNADKEQLLADFRRLQERLEEELPPAEQTKVYIDLVKLMRKVDKHIFRNDESVRKGVDDIMGGKAYELYSDILEKRGEKRGRKEGREEGEISAFRKMVQLGKLTIAEAAEMAGMTTDAFKKMAML